MAISKAKKAEILEKLSHVAKGAGSRVFVKFSGLSVADATAMRAALRAESVQYMVAKKTLLKLAFGRGAAEGEMPDLQGEIAIAYADDSLSPAREIYKFQKSLKDRIAIVGGIFEGKFADQALMLSIATIPGREVLLGQLVNLINSPIQGFAMALSEVAKKREV
ncbi:50S ribosomal protein L10 [bacterium]|nr:50S ribosomal protein L10 [bacterium]